MEGDCLAYFKEAVKILISNVTSLIQAAEAIRDCEAFIESSKIDSNFEKDDIQQNCEVRSSYECICICMWLCTCLPINYYNLTIAISYLALLVILYIHTLA